jgi:hypothetical protein
MAGHVGVALWAGCRRIAVCDRTAFLADPPEQADRVARKIVVRQAAAVITPRL